MQQPSKFFRAFDCSSNGPAFDSQRSVPFFINSMRGHDNKHPFLVELLILVAQMKALVEQNFLRYVNFLHVDVIYRTDRPLLQDAF